MSIEQKEIDQEKCAQMEMETGEKYVIRK